MKNTAFVFAIIGSLVMVYALPISDCKCPDLRTKAADNAQEILGLHEKPGCVRNLTCYKDYETYIVMQWKNSEIQKPADAVEDHLYVTTELDRNAPMGPTLDIFSYFGMICENNEWYITKYPLGIIWMDDGGSYLNHAYASANEGKKTKIDEFNCELFQ